MYMLWSLVHYMYVMHMICLFKFSDEFAEGCTQHEFEKQRIMCL